MSIPFFACRRARRLMRRLAGSREQVLTRAMLEAHLATCENCAALWHQLQAATDLVVGIPVPELGEDYCDQLATSIQSRIAAKAVSATPCLRENFRPKWIALAGVVLLVATLGFGYRWLPREIRPTHQGPPGIVRIPASAPLPPTEKEGPFESSFAGKVWEFPGRPERGWM